MPLGTGVVPAPAAVAVPVGDPVGAPGVGDAVVVSPVSGPCSFSITARIWASYDVSRDRISESGTEAMSAPKAAISFHSASSWAVAVGARAARRG